MSDKYSFIIQKENCPLVSYFKNYGDCYNAIQTMIYNKILGNNEEHPGPEEYALFLERIRLEQPNAKFVFDFDAIEAYKLPNLNLLFRALLQNVLSLCSYFLWSNIQLFIRKEFLELPMATQFTDSAKLLHAPRLIVVR